MWMLALCTEVGNDGMQVDAASVPEKKVEIEAASAVLVNPSRVLPPQEKHIKLAEGSRYVPVKHKYTTRPILSGFVLLKDLQPAEAEVLALTDGALRQRRRGRHPNAHAQFESLFLFYLDSSS